MTKIVHLIVHGHWPDVRIVRAPEPPYFVMWRWCAGCEVHHADPE